MTTETNLDETTETNLDEETARAADRDREGTLYAAYSRAKGTEDESRARAEWCAFVDAEAEA